MCRSLDRRRRLRWHVGEKDARGRWLGVDLSWWPRSLSWRYRKYRLARCFSFCIHRGWDRPLLSFAFINGLIFIFSFVDCISPIDDLALSQNLLSLNYFSTLMLGVPLNARDSPPSGRRPRLLLSPWFTIAFRVATSAPILSRPNKRVPIRPLNQFWRSRSRSGRGDFSILRRRRGGRRD